MPGASTDTAGGQRGSNSCRGSSSALPVLRLPVLDERRSKNNKTRIRNVRKRRNKNLNAHLLPLPVLFKCKLYDGKSEKKGKQKHSTR